LGFKETVCRVLPPNQENKKEQKIEGQNEIEEIKNPRAAHVQFSLRDFQSLSLHR